jgi:hypothetical protein
MQERIEKELVLLRQRYPNLEYRQEGQWVRIPSYLLPAGWDRPSTDVAFQIPVGYPGTPPYGIYTPQRSLFNKVQPENYQQAQQQPPLGGGPWWVFSWQPQDGQWRPTADIVSGSNLLNWVLGFSDRFREGK